MRIQQCSMCDQQSLRSDCAYLECLSLNVAAQASLSLHLSNHMSLLNYHPLEDGKRMTIITIFVSTLAHWPAVCQTVTVRAICSKAGHLYKTSISLASVTLSSRYTVNSEIFARVYFRETSHMRSSVKIEPLRNGVIILSSTVMDNLLTSREFRTW